VTRVTLAKTGRAVMPEDDDDPLPPDATDEDGDGGKSPADKPDDKTKGPKSPGDMSTAPLREILAEEDASLKSVLDNLGADGSFKISVFRIEPEEWIDPQSGRRVKTAGKLKTYNTRIDEDVLADKHGGGKYMLRFLRRNSKGSYKFLTQRTIDIAGDPRVDDVPRTSAPVAGSAPVATGENTGLVKEAFHMLRDQLERVHDDRAPVAPKGIDPAMQMMVDQMRRDAERRDAEMAELRRDLTVARNVKPVEDPIKDKLLGSLIDGQSGHVEALKLRQESELRQLKESAIEEQRRRDDRHERDVAMIRTSYEREIAAMRSSHESSTTIATQTHNLQVNLLERDNKRLERELDNLRIEIKNLRERKDKTIVEQAKDLEAVKDALGMDSGDKTNFDKFLEVATSPAAAEFVGRIVGGKEPGAAPSAPLAAAPARAAPTRQLVQDPDTGGKYWLMTDGKGGSRLVPAKRKPQVIPATTTADGTVVTPAIELPEVDPGLVTSLVTYLERAYSGKQEPEVVAQSGRASVPDEILTWIRTHDSEQVSGVDLFMSKVAKLPSTSPLSTQSGRNWLRRVGKALVGE
jgi:hypothetical protein